MEKFYNNTGKKGERSRSTSPDLSRQLARSGSRDRAKQDKVNEEVIFQDYLNVYETRLKNQYANDKQLAKMQRVVNARKETGEWPFYQEYATTRVLEDFDNYKKERGNR